MIMRPKTLLRPVYYSVKFYKHYRWAVAKFTGHLTDIHFSIVSC